MTLIILIFNVRAYRKNHFENNSVDNVIFIEMIPESDTFRKSYNIFMIFIIILNINYFREVLNYLCIFVI